MRMMGDERREQENRATITRTFNSSRLVAPSQSSSPPAPRSTSATAARSRSADWRATATRRFASCVIVDHGAGILEQMASQHRHDPLSSSITPRRAQLLHAGDARRARRLAANAGARRSPPLPRESRRRVTAATTPFVSRIVRTARSHDAGAPMRIAVAIGFGFTVTRSANPPRKLAANGAAPLAWIAAMRGTRVDQAERVRLAQRFAECRRCCRGCRPAARSSPARPIRVARAARARSSSAPRGETD